MKINLIFSTVLLTLLGALSISSLASAITAEEVLKRAQDKYASIKDLSAEFKRTVEGASTDGDQAFKGKIYLKKPNKFRLETEDRLIISDGKTLWRYSPENGQVIIDSLQHSLWLEGLSFDYSQKFHLQLLGMERIGKAKCYLLKLIPKAKDTFLSKLRVWVDGKVWLVRKVESLDLNGRVAAYSFTKIRLNEGIDDSFFTFDIPEGVEVIETR